jgi:hypothetical protein
MSKKENRMKVSQQASKGHLIVGAILVLLSLGCFIATFFLQQKIFSFLIFFFGIWGGVELGRYLEHSLQK